MVSSECDFLHWILGTPVHAQNRRICIYANVSTRNALEYDYLHQSTQCVYLHQLYYNFLFRLYFFFFAVVIQYSSLTDSRCVQIMRHLK